MKKSVIFFFLYLFLFSSFLIFAQQKKEIYALRIDKPINVDGFLNELEWKKAPEAGQSIWFQSERKPPDTANTSVKILYDDDFIYFGFFCYDPQPDKIEARVTERDEDIRDDDSVYVLIDTIHDKENFYYFGTNIFGTQFDGRIKIDETADPAWDGVWKSACRKTDFGWSAEIAIDLSSLNYKPREEKTLRLSLSRIVPRNLETSFWKGPLDPAFDISQIGQLKSINLIKEEKKIKISPHLISSSEAGAETWLEWGLDVHYAFSQSISGHLALNPDFATVEADEEQINLTRFELYFPEKRSYFLEDSEIYSQPVRLFYSKRIPNIYGGLKISGKSGGLEFSGMSALARRDEYTEEDLANFSVLSFKKNLMKSSSIGFLAANKLINGKNIGTAGIDTSFFLSYSFKVAAQFALSYGDYNSGNIAFFLCPSYDSETFHFHLGYSHLGEKFGDNVNKVGFIKDDNRRELDSSIVKTFLVKKGPIDHIKYDLSYNIYWGMNRTLRSWQIDQEITFDLKNKFSLIAHHTQEFKAQDNIIFGEDFKNNLTKLGIGLNTKEWQYAILSVSFGRNFGNTFKMVEIAKNLQMTPSLTVEFSLASIYFIYGRSGRNQLVHMLRAYYYFTKDFFIKIFYQTNTLIKKSNKEFLLSYRFLPPSGFIQLVYQIGRGRSGEKGTKGNILCLNIYYMF